MALVSPILNRELLTFLRAKRAFVGLLVFLVILAGAAVICWWAALSAGMAYNRDLLSRSLFYTVTITQLFIFSAYALILTSTKINAERDEKTFDLLVTAPLSSVHIVLAKYASALAVILLLVFASAPVLSLCFLLGGVSRQQVLWTYHIILLAILSYGMLGMACSTVCRKNYVALMSGFILALMCYGGLALLIRLLLHLVWPDREPILAGMKPEEFAVAIFVTTSPIGAYLVGIAGTLGAPIPLKPIHFLALHTAFQVLVFVISFVVAWQGFRSLAGRRAETPRRKFRFTLWDRKTDAVAPKEAAPKPATRSRRHRPINDWLNPVFAREHRMFLSRRWKHRLIRYALVAVVFLIVWSMFSESNYTFDEFMCPLGITTTLLMGLFAPFLAARAVTSERETNSLPLLVVTPLRPLQVLLGKTAVTLFHAFRFVLLFTLILVLTAAARPRGGEWKLLSDWAKILGPLFAILLYFVSVGTLFSVLCRRTVTAVVLTYATIIALASIPLFLGIISAIAVHFPIGGNDKPLGALSTLLIPITSPGFYFAPMKEVNHWYQNSQWGTALGYSAVMLFVSCGILLFAEIKFARKYYGAFQRDARPD
jgi:ABC-type transport system involved in multi-copper enzyme maturation permease subunit